MVNVLDAALRFLPNVVVGCIVNVITGHLVSRMRADCLVSAGNFMCAMAPLIIALAESSTGYWKQVFWGVALSPISADSKSTAPSSPTHLSQHTDSFGSCLHGCQSHHSRRFSRRNTRTCRRCIQYGVAIRLRHWPSSSSHHLRQRDENKP